MVLNPIMAGTAATSEASDFTSVQERIADWLAIARLMNPRTSRRFISPAVAAKSTTRFKIPTTIGMYVDSRAATI